MTDKKNIENYVSQKDSKVEYILSLIHYRKKTKYKHGLSKSNYKNIRLPHANAKTKLKLVTFLRCSLSHPKDEKLEIIDSMPFLSIEQIKDLLKIYKRELKQWKKMLEPVEDEDNGPLDFLISDIKSELHQTIRQKIKDWNEIDSELKQLTL